MSATRFNVPPQFNKVDKTINEGNAIWRDNDVVVGYSLP
jgi:hypothetical protein